MLLQQEGSAGRTEEFSALSSVFAAAGKTSCAGAASSSKGPSQPLHSRNQVQGQCWQAGCPQSRRGALPSWVHQNALRESWRMGRVNVRAALSVPALIPCTANTCSGYKWVHEEFISCAVSGFCIPLLTFWSTEGYHSCFVLCCPSPSCALFLSLLQQSHLGIHKTPIKFSLPQLLQEQKNVSFTSQTF